MDLGQQLVPLVVEVQGALPFAGCEKRPLAQALSMRWT